MRPLFLAGVVCFLASHAEARAPKPSSFFLAADPHVPLAVVAEGRVQTAVPLAVRGKSCGAPNVWRRVGSHWRALDAWGQVIGTDVVAGKDDYEEGVDLIVTLSDEADAAVSAASA